MVSKLLPKSPRLEPTSSVNDVINVNRPLFKSVEIWSNKQKAKAILIAKNRRKIQELLYNTKLSDTEVARQITAMGLKQTRERIRQVRKKLGVEKTNRTNLIQVYEIIVQDPQITYKELAKKLNVSYSSAISFCRGHGIKLRDSMEITEKEKEKIDTFFRIIGIYKTPQYRRDVRTFVDRYVFYSELGIVVEDNPWILMRSPNIILDKIAFFDSVSIDWKKNPHLFQNKLDRIKNNLPSFDVVGATHQLDHLLASNLSPNIVAFNKEKYDDLRTDIKNKDFKSVLRWVPGFVKNNLLRFDVSYVIDEHLEIGREAVLEVLANCKFPEKNPSILLALISHNVRFKLLEYFYKNKKEKSLEDYREVYDPDSETGVGLARNYKDDDY